MFVFDYMFFFACARVRIIAKGRLSYSILLCPEHRNTSPTSTSSKVTVSPVDEVTWSVAGVNEATEAGKVSFQNPEASADADCLFPRKMPSTLAPASDHPQKLIGRPRWTVM